MSLKTKTLTIIGGTAIGLVAVLYLATRFLILRNFASLEERDTRQNLERVLDTLRDDLTALDNTCRGSANWDKAYAFVQNGDPEFVRTNIGFGAFSDAADRRLNALLYLNANGQVVFGEGFDFEAKKEKPTPTGLQEHLQPEDPLLKDASTKRGVAGFILLPQGLLLVASRPVLTTEGKGPIRGWLIIGRFLDAEEIRRLSQKTHLSLSLLPADDPRAPAELVAPAFRAAPVAPQMGEATPAGSKSHPRPDSSAGGPGLDSTNSATIMIRPLSAEMVAGYAVIRDIYGNGPSVLRVDVPREIYRRGRASVLYFAASLLLTSLVFVVVSLGLLKRVVLSRLMRLGASVGTIAASGDVSARVSVTGDDELSRLGDATNRMLDALEQAQLRRQESEARYQTLVEHAPEAIVVLDAEAGRFIDANNNAVELFRLAKKELLSCTVSDLSAPVQPDGRAGEELAKSRIQEALDGGTPVFEWVHRDSAGVDIPCEVRLVRLPAAHRLLVRGSITDIRERKRADKNLEERTAFLNALIENSPLAIVAVGTENRVEFCNSAFERLFQYRLEEILGCEIDRLITPPAQLEEANEYSEQTESGRLVHGTAVRRRKDGTLVDVELYGVPLKIGDRIAGVYGLYQDITERKQAERDLHKAKEAAEAASRAKSQFLANMSHEIRTPMNGILGMTDLTLDTVLTPEQSEYLGMVRTSADALLTIINDVLDFSKIEAGKLDLDPISFRLRESLAQTMKALGFRAHQKGLELTCDIHPEVPDLVVADPGRLRQIIVNLVGNAVKFTEQGEVGLKVALESRTDQQAQLHFVVRDTGIGIAREKQEVVFEAFSQADASMTRRFGGTGLGLSISSRLVKMMGGRIWLESELGRGSCFHFTTRVGVAAGASAEPIEQADLAGTRVLVVDDNLTNRSILGRMLEGWGMKPALVECGAEALKLIRNADPLRPFRLILADLYMPGMDGFTLVEQIRHHVDLRQTSIMMLTSAGQRGDGARCRELGIAAYLIKPITQAELLDAILRILSRKERQVEEPHLVTRHWLREERRSLRVLLAEDNTVNQMLASRLLEKRGHTVAVASDGRAALKTLEKQPFDVVLMDVQMPEMDGFEATAAIRAREHGTGTHVPIIAMTAHAVTGDRERCLAAGMDGYLSKPVEAKELFAAIEGLVGTAENVA